MLELIVRADDVSKTYGRGPTAVTAVRSATLSVAPAERIALNGPSGSGKTTLLHLIGGLDRPSSGVIDWPALPRPLRPGPVAFAFQGSSLLTPLTCAENVSLPLLLAGREEGAASLEALGLLERFGLAAMASHLPEELSGGQAQRVALARALAGSPRLILADEPTGQQDHGTATRTIGALLEHVEVTGAALVLATHDEDVSSAFETRWTIDAGRLRTGAFAG
jgi:ABC-type lipoprotein export system ATPase subunit